MKEQISAQSLGQRSKYDYRQIVGTGRAMRTVFGLLDKYIDTDDPVMISGESGANLPPNPLSGTAGCNIRKIFGMNGPRAAARPAISGVEPALRAPRTS